MSSISVQYGTLQNGFTSIATYQGLDPHQMAYMNCLHVDPKHPSDYKLKDTDGLDWRSRFYPTLMAGHASHIVTSNVCNRHSDYLHTHVVKGMMTALPTLHEEYPSISLVKQLASELQKNPNGDITKGLDGKKLVNSYFTHEFADLCNQMQSPVLVDPNAYPIFLSKAYVHAVADEIGLNVAPAYVFNDPEEVTFFHEKISDVSGKNKQPVWIKAAALSGGQGIIKLHETSYETVQQTLNQVALTYKDTGFFGSTEHVIQHANTPFEGINHFMPIIAELDIGSVKGVKKVVANMGIQGVMSANAVTLVGSALQVTKPNGEYVAPLLTGVNDQPAIEAAQKEAAKLFVRMAQDGYRGLAGIDVIVAEMEDNSLQGFVLETNPRLTSATPVISFAQQIEAMTGKKMAGTTCTQTFKTDKTTSLESNVDSVYDLIDDDLYCGKETHYTGLVPYMFDHRNNGELVVRCAALGKSREDNQNLVRKWGHKVKHSPFGM